MFNTWLIIFIILVVIELLTINLVTIWFAIGALVAAITSLFTNSKIILCSIFTIVSIISLVLTKEIIKRTKSKKTIATNLDRIIGKVGIVTKDITTLEPGEVKVDGKYWSAISTSKIKKNSTVEILSIDGVKLKVKMTKEKN